MNTFVAIIGSVFLALGSSTIAQKPTYCTEDVSKCNTAGINITCVSPKSGSTCVEDVAAGNADLALGTVDKLVQNEDKLKIVVGENIEGITDNFVRYYGLAVVKKGTAFNFKQLEGKKSCHTGVGKTVGWKIPVGYLLYEKEMTCTDNQYKSTADFFAESCAPGINKIDEATKEVKDDLCRLCNGTGDKRCTSDDPYAGYTGAFKCMADGNQDRVGFVKQDTAHEVFTKYPGRYGNESDYELLCTNGMRKELSAYKTCNIDKRPAHAVVTSKDKSGKMVAQYVQMLKGANFTKLKIAGLVTSHSRSVLEYANDVETYVGKYGKLYKALFACSDGVSSMAVSTVFQVVAIFAVLFVF